jgi:hypothetical protein
MTTPKPLTREAWNPLAPITRRDLEASVDLGSSGWREAALILVNERDAALSGYATSEATATALSKQVDALKADLAEVTRQYTALAEERDALHRGYKSLAACLADALADTADARKAVAEAQADAGRLRAALDLSAPHAAKVSP